MIYKDLTKAFMEREIRTKSIEDIEWFIALVENNTDKPARNPRTNESVLSPDWKVIRKEYAKRFYPDLVKKTTKTVKPSMLDGLKALVEEKKKA